MRALGTFAAGLGLATLFATGAAAQVDISGSWSVSSGQLASVYDFIDIHQDGTALEVCVQELGMVGSGTIDPATGAFTIDFQLPLVCSLSWAGTAAADGSSFIGTETVGVVCGHCGGTCLPGNSDPIAGARDGSGRSFCCGDGVVESPEACDAGPGGDACCTSFCTPQGAGETCASDSNGCTDDVCDANGICQHVPNSAPCRDVCVDGTCSGGSCIGMRPVPAGTPCAFDTNVCIQNVCDGAGTCAATPVVCADPCAQCVFSPPVGCIDNPRSECELASEAAIKIVRTPNDGGNTILWTMKSSAAGSPGLGDPTATTDYTLCAYTFPGGGDAQAFLRAQAPAGGTCGNSPCWTLTSGRGGHRFSYRDPDKTPDGVRAASLREVAREQLILRLRGSGAMLQLPAALPTGLDVFTNLVATDHGVFRGCWRADFYTPTVSTASHYKANH